MQYLLFVSSVTVWAVSFVVTLFGSLLGCELLTSAANIDRETRTLTYEGTSISLDSLAGVRRLRVGLWTVLWLSFVSGRAGRTTRRLLVLPADVYEDVAEEFHAGIAQEVEPGETNRAHRRAFLATAFGFLGVAIGVFSLLFFRLALFD